MSTETRIVAVAVCAFCSRPVAANEFVCWPCTDRAADSLAWIAEFAGDLDVTVTRLDRIGERSGVRGNSDEIPLPFNENASDVAWVLRSTLTAWTRTALDRLGLVLPDTEQPMSGPLCRSGIGCRHASCFEIRWKVTNDPRSPRALARFLAGHLRDFRRWPDAPEAFEELSYAAVILRRAFDVPVALTPLGRCDSDGCAGELLAPKGSTLITCRDCGAPYDVDRRRRELLERLEDELVTAVVAAGVISAYQPLALPVNTLYTWVHRGRLFRKGDDPDTLDPTYRLGDIMDLYRGWLVRKLKAAA